ncbi:MAG: hypothetical protein LLG00_11290 [Planctomycetaceae bacterium]|nr:hypothetical protein [Planctomycetaceae bacterium]
MEAFVAASVVLGVKFAGYSLAASIISRAYGRSDLSSFMVGGWRVVFGVVGIAVWGIAACIGTLAQIVPRGPTGAYLLWSGLIPIRLIEWWALLWLLYDRPVARVALGWKVAILGTLWSFVLDIAVFFFVLYQALNHSI